MTVQASLIPEIEEALRHGSPKRRVATLERVTDLFLQGAERFSDEQVRLFDDVLGRLIVKIETQALIDLAERLAPVPQAPAEVVRSLARHGDIAVARTVLQYSPRLQDGDLAEIAGSHGQSHLLAISGRGGIGAAVTDVLVRRGDHEVVRTVVNNRAARFSDTGFAALVARASQDDVLAMQVGRREDIPAPLFRRLVTQATAIVQERLLANARPEKQAEIRRVLAKVAHEVGAPGAQPRDYAAAQQAIAELQAAGQLQELDVATFATAGKLEMTVVALATLCRISVQVVERLIGGSRPDPVLILCKAMRFRWETATAVLSLRLGKRSPSMESAQVQFERLSAATAERVLHFWRARPAPAGESL
jgi:uncharacterized protein (DUF2336 family)